MLGEQFAGLPTVLYAQIEKMLEDRKVTKTEYNTFMAALSKLNMKEGAKKELENMIAEWIDGKRVNSFYSHTRPKF